MRREEGYLTKNDNRNERKLGFFASVRGWIEERGGQGSTVSWFLEKEGDRAGVEDGKKYREIYLDFLQLTKTPLPEFPRS